MAQNTQTMIVRQSQIKLALEVFQMKGITPTILELLAVTDHLVDYVENGLSPEIITKTKKVDTFIEAKKNSK
jgi:hypothetical protein